MEIQAAVCHLWKQTAHQPVLGSPWLSTCLPARLRSQPCLTFPFIIFLLDDILQNIYSNTTLSCHHSSINTLTTTLRCPSYSCQPTLYTQTKPNCRKLGNNGVSLPCHLPRQLATCRFVTATGDLAPRSSRRSVRDLTPFIIILLLGSCVMLMRITPWAKST